MKDLLNKNLYKADNFVYRRNSYIIPLKAATILANVDPREAGILYFIEIL